MKHKMPEDIERCCALCEYVQVMEITGNLLCTRKNNLKKVTENDCCNKFSFDILSYKPKPSKLPKFSIDSAEEFI